MADIDFYQDDTGDTQDDDDAGLCGEYEAYDPDAGLTPVQKLQNYMDSDNILSREMVVRSLLETMRSIGDNTTDAKIVLNAIIKLSEDPEFTVRAELVDQIPHIAMYCHENSHLFPDEDPISGYILPVVVKYLNDSHNQVRKTSQPALLVLLEQGLVNNIDVEELVCPVILDLASPDKVEEFRTEAAALMSKMAPLVGKDITERVFLTEFSTLCTDALFHVRKVCAANFGDFCTVVGQENTEMHLLPKFYYLCEDAVWGVRKACAECFMAVSCACSLDTRRKELAPLFISLICDQSRWVRMAAFQALGGFISTFADPSITGLYFSEDGLLIVGDPSDFKKGDRRNSSGSESEDTPPTSPRQVKSGESVPSVATSGDPTVKEMNTCLEEVAMDLDVEGESGNKETLMVGAAGQEGSDGPSLEEKRADCYRLTSSANSTLSNTASPDGSRGDCETKSANTGTEGGSVANPAEAISSIGNKINLAEQGCNVRQLNVTSQTAEQSEEATPSVREDRVQSKNQGQKSESFNSFQFWRAPLPVVDVKSHLSCDTSNISDNAPAVINKSNSDDQVVPNLDVVSITSGVGAVHIQGDSDLSTEGIMMYTANVNMVNEESETVANIGSTHVLGEHLEEGAMHVVNGIAIRETGADSLTYSPSDSLQSLPGSGPMSLGEDDQPAEYSNPLQDVIPQSLLDHYLSMTDPSRAQTVDTEIARHCAYSLPAVAYTLGRHHWPCLRELYENLAGDMQWKVRRTLAFSIHELAMIVGEDITNRDLVPIFNGFLRDLDEVRIGVLRHLAEFLSLLKPDIRQDNLTKITDFLNIDNSRNWRFREELALQLIQLLDLYSPKEISDFIVPIALQLAEDKVSQVRKVAYIAMSKVLQILSELEEDTLALAFTNDIIVRFADGTNWSRRQMFAQFCDTLLSELAVTPEQFARDFLPSLMALSADNIPNIRIALARTLASHIINSDFFTSAQNPHHERLMEMIQALKSDPDADVRYFMTGLHQTNIRGTRIDHFECYNSNDFIETQNSCEIQFQGNESVPYIL